MEQSASTVRPIKKVDNLIKKHILLYVINVLNKNGIYPNYKETHIKIRDLQNILQIKYGKTLGYKFEDGGIYSIYNVYDKELQNDLESYSTFDNIIDNSDEIITNDPIEYYSHKLSLREKGKFLLKYNVIETLSKLIPDLSLFDSYILNTCTT